jgi:hypothetical protein
MPTTHHTLMLTALLAVTAAAPAATPPAPPLPASAPGPRAATAPPDTARLSLTSPSGSASIPIDPRGNILYFRGRINDSDSLWMVLDSGASNNAIDAGVARSLGLEIAQGGVAHGAGGTVETGSVRDVTIRLPGATLAGTSLGTLPLEAFRRQTGRAMDVILGHPLLSRSVVRVDYAARTLEILPADTFHYSGRGAVIPLTFQDRLPYITARVTLPGRGPLERRFVIDLGSAQALILSAPFVRDERVLEALPRTIQGRGRGVGGQTQTLVGRVTCLEIAGMRIDQPITVLRVSDQGVISARGTAGNIGGEILRRFTVIFDYRRKRMILEPNQRLGEAFEADMGGLGLRMGPEGSNALQVDWIQPGSPATEAGMQPEDLIERIDGRSAIEVGIPALREMFRREGETHRLGIRRGDATMEVSLTNRRMI